MNSEEQLAQQAFVPEKQTALFGLMFATGEVFEFVQSLLKQLFNQNLSGGQIKDRGIGRAFTILPSSMNDIVGMKRSRIVFSAVRDLDLRTTDGMSLVWLAKLKGCRGAGRLYGPDIMKLSIRLGRKYRLRHFFYGGTPAILRNLRSQLCRISPGYLTAGEYAPPFRDLTSLEFKEVCAQINRAHPDIVWIGIGSWKQVVLAKQFVQHCQVPLIMPVGAAFDFLSGQKSQAPQIMMRLGLEWSYRLWQEPTRLWRRYILQIPVFIVFSVIELLNYFKKDRTIPS